MARRLTLIVTILALNAVTVAPAAAQAWTSMNSGTSEVLEGVWFTSPTDGWIVGDNGTTRFTTDGGETWAIELLTAGDVADVAFRDVPAVGLAVADNGEIFRSVAGGAWSQVPSGTSANLLNVAFGGPGLAHASGRDGTILRSTDDGATWSVVETGADRYRDSSAQGASAWHVGDNGVMRATTDGGASWFSQNAGVTDDLNGVHFVSPTEGWVVGSNSAVRYTNDGGATWTERSTGVSGGLNAIHFVDANRGWIVGDVGAVFATTNGGLFWVSESGGTLQNLNDVHFLDATWGWAVGDAGALIVRDGVTGVEASGPGSRTGTLSSAPNPFSTDTRIRYSIAHGGSRALTISVHDVTGRLVRVLLQGTRATGEEEVHWDGRDASGRPVASGVYLVKVTDGGEAATRRIVRLRM